MVFFLIYFSANLENITNLRPQEGCDDPHLAYYVKLKCGQCGEECEKDPCLFLSETITFVKKMESPKYLCISRSETVACGRRTFNLVKKCKLCGREGTIQMIPGHGKPLMLDINKKSTRLMVFEVNGFEPIKVSLGERWKAESTNGTEFDVDLSTGKFEDFDEKGLPVAVLNPTTRFKVVRKYPQRWNNTIYFE